MPKPKECDCALFVNCACEFEAAVRGLSPAFHQALQSLEHGSMCALTECGQCTCEVGNIIDFLAAQVKPVIDAGRKAFSPSASV